MATHQDTAPLTANGFSFGPSPAGVAAEIGRAMDGDSFHECDEVYTDDEHDFFDPHRAHAEAASMPADNALKWMNSESVHH